MVDDELRASASRLLAEAPCVVILPAGCGKTHLVAASARVASDLGKRVLILTHTHAGVDEIRRRARSFGVPSNAAKITTIDSWSHRLVASFPRSSSYVCTEEIVWCDVHGAMARLMTNPHIQAMVRESYDYVVVDEYQDCSLPQHAFVMAVADLVPTIILGDPLQAIYGFGGPLVDWKTDLSDFPVFRMPIVPWRWRGHNEALGDYLMEVRSKLEAGEAFDASGGPVTWVSDTPDHRRSVCWSKVGAVGNVVLLVQFPRQCEALARSLGGKFGVMEDVEGSLLLNLARIADGPDGLQTAAAIVDFAFKSHAKLPPDLKVKGRAMKAGTFPTFRPSSSLGPVITVLKTVEANPSPTTIEAAFSAIDSLGGTLFRKEAWSDMLRAIRVWHEGAATLAEAVRTVRDRCRIVGRRQTRLSVSRPVLIKGQQFDECVIVGADALNARELYVAMTRPRTNLTVIRENPVLSPS